MSMLATHFRLDQITLHTLIFIIFYGINQPVHILFLVPVYFKVIILSDISQKPFIYENFLGSVFLDVRRP